jgi:hypothetical protein
VAIVADAHGDANVLIRPTRIGDLNLDGAVTISDFIDLASQFNQPGQLTWQEGDLNYDGQVTIADFIDLAANFNTSYVQSAGAAADVSSAAVPEPTLLSTCVLALVLRVRRRVTRYTPSSVAR